MKITRRHPFTGKETTMYMDITEQQMARMESGELIQNVCPSLSEDDREFFISGLTGQEFDQIINEDEK